MLKQGTIRFIQILMLSAVLCCTVWPAGPAAAVEVTGNSYFGKVDHLIYAAPDLDRGIANLEGRLGIKAAPGGRHPGMGTRNALIALGPNSYIEIIAPDPQQPHPPFPLPYMIDSLKEPRLVTWVAKCSDVPKLANDAKNSGVKLGRPMPLSRKTPEGNLLNWILTDPTVIVADGIIPAFIDWGNTPHPALTGAKGARLVSLKAVHPDAHGIMVGLKKLGLDLPVANGDRPALTALIDCPKGRVELR